VDGRVLPGLDEEFAATLDELTGPDVSWEYAHQEVPLEASLDAPLMASMTRALLAEDPGSTVVPYCMSGGTDAKQFARLGLACYGFTRWCSRGLRLLRHVPRHDERILCPPWRPASGSWTGCCGRFRGRRYPAAKNFQGFFLPVSAG